MSRNFLIPLFAGFLLSAPIASAETMMIKEIDVQVDLTAVTNPAAAARYANIAADLQSAVAARLTDRIADEGAKVTIDVSEVELSNSFQDALGLADSTLVGDVKITDSNDNTHFKAFNLTVNIGQAKTFFAEGVDVTVQNASTDDYYHAMIEAFAENVVIRLDE
ncbi:MAG: hypothetical protein WCC57_12000 [Paracoccaceae bacterium]